MSYMTALQPAPDEAPRPRQAATVMPPPGEWQALVPRPGSITWRRASDARLLVAAGYALLLQVSHPTVGAGVSEHSEFRRDPWGRLLRTLDYTYTMVYGGPSAAGEMGRRIRSFHRRIRGIAPDGRPYHALEPSAYAWVHATLAEAIVLAHERFGRRFDDAERERFWAEWRALGRLLGIRERDLPPDWARFSAYVQEMVLATLVHTPAVDEVLTALARPSAPAVSALRGPRWSLARIPLGHVLQLTTVGLLPSALRRSFALRWTPAQEFELRSLAVALRSSTPIMPSWLKNTGAGYLRWRAQAIAHGDAAAPRRLARDGG